MDDWQYGGDPVGLAYKNSFDTLDSVYSKAYQPRDKAMQSEGAVRPLLNSITDMGQGPATGDQLQQILGSAQQRADQARLGVSQGQRGTLDSLNSFANVLGRVGPNDIDALAEAHNLMRNVTDVDQMLNSDPMLQRRMQQQQYLNSRGIREYGNPADVGGNYMKLDSWDAIAADKAKQRDANIQQMGAALMANILPRTQAFQQKNRREDLNTLGTATQNMASAQNLQSQTSQRNMENGPVEGMSPMLRAELGDKQSRSNLANAQAYAANNPASTLNALHNAYAKLASSADPDPARLDFLQSQIESVSKQMKSGQPNIDGTAGGGAEAATEFNEAQLKGIASVIGTPQEAATLDAISKKTGKTVEQLKAMVKRGGPQKAKSK